MIKFLNRKEKADYVKALADSEEGIMYAIKALDSISQSDEEWRRERDYIDAINTELSIRDTAIREGLQQGLQQGIEQGIQQGAHENAIENAKNFLKMNKLSVEDIAQGTGLSVEEVQKLAEEIGA